MGFPILIVFLLGIEVTLQFSQIPWDHEPSTNDDYAGCIFKTVEKLRGDTTTNLRFYTGDDMANEASLIAESLYNMKQPVSLLITNNHQVDQNRIFHEKICIAVVNTVELLYEVLDMLYRKIHHGKCVICVTFQCQDAIENLSKITAEIWTTGVPRNVIFIVSNVDTGIIQIIGVPAYSRENCIRAKLVEVGQYRGGKFLGHGIALYPRLNDLGGCELSVMVQPPMLPYVERMEESPGGVVGDFMDTMAASMNFTPKYVWSVTYDDMMKHLYSRDLNLMVDMTPRATLPPTDYKFSIGVVGVSFIVPRRSKSKTWRKLFTPFDRSIWLIIVVILGSLALLSTLSSGTDSGNIVLKTFGTLLGVGVGIIKIEGGWIRIFLWCWLLPAYVLVQSYLACLAKDITIPIFVPEIQNLEELADSKLDVLCSTSTQRGICKLEGKKYQKLCRKCRIVSDEEIWSDFYPNLMSTGLMNDTAVVANLEFLEAHPAFLNVYALEDKVTRVNQLAEVRPGSSWIFEMEKIWDRIFASGLAHYWRRRYIDRKRRKAASNAIGLFRPEFGWCSFILLVVGWFVSAGCFFIELMLHRFVNTSLPYTHYRT